MASNNFENKMKSGLEERRLQPSAQSWNQLQSQLDAQEKKRSFKRYWFMAIAASFIGVLLLNTWMFTSKSNTNIQIVDIKSTVKNTEIVTDSSELNQDTIAISSLKNQEKEQIETETRIQNVVTSNKKKKSHTTVATKKEELEFAKINLIKKDTVLNSALAQQDIPVSSDYIEDLLQQAEQQIISEKALKASLQTVNSKELLENVEFEIEDSFRDKVFDAVKSGFVKVKTAVVERNN